MSINYRKFECLYLIDVLQVDDGVLSIKLWKQQQNIKQCGIMKCAKCTRGAFKSGAHLRSAFGGEVLSIKVIQLLTNPVTVIWIMN